MCRSNQSYSPIKVHKTKVIYTIRSKPWYLHWLPINDVSRYTHYTYDCQGNDVKGLHRIKHGQLKLNTPYPRSHIEGTTMVTWEVRTIILRHHSTICRPFIPSRSIFRKAWESPLARWWPLLFLYSGLKCIWSSFQDSAHPPAIWRHLLLHLSLRQTLSSHVLCHCCC